MINNTTTVAQFVSTFIHEVVELCFPLNEKKELDFGDAFDGDDPTLHYITQDDLVGPEVWMRKHSDPGAYIATREVDQFHAEVSVAGSLAPEEAERRCRTEVEHAISCTTRTVLVTIGRWITRECRESGDPCPTIQRLHELALALEECDSHYVQLPLEWKAPTQDTSELMGIAASGKIYKGA